MTLFFIVFAVVELILLIDRDALNIGEYEREDDDTGTLEISLGGLLDLYHKVKDAPTVIEAEGVRTNEFIYKRT